MRLIIIFLSVFAWHSAFAQSLRDNLAWGRIILLDLGSLIKSQPLIQNPDLIRVYTLSGLEDETQKSIIAIQGLSDKGATDISLDTEAGLRQIQISLGETSVKDRVLDPHKQKICVKDIPYDVQEQRSIIVETDAPVNEFILASRPDLLELKHLVSEKDPRYFRTFVLVPRSKGLSDLIIATQKQVYKLVLNIGGNNNNEHTEYIKLDTNFCQH